MIRWYATAEQQPMLPATAARTFGTSDSDNRHSTKPAPREAPPSA